ncbi:transcriptional regulator [Mycobacteroides stephanolepidis]|jgi:AraC-like DNA-binding protein|uniref:Transcriptional regulator n=2 Tax=[Mycobacterium] stephanolepidis TaxID=1520670 RepID=A0A1Z4F0R8_9MYCO|nr:transcriptional regulator [[Mycobacterium] stephanolepidis]
MPDELRHIEPTIPIHRLEAMLALAVRKGWEVDDLLHKAGVSPALLVDGRSRITRSQLVTVVQELWAHTDDEMFGLGPAPMPRGTFRLLGCAMFYAAVDVGAVATRFMEMHHVLPSIPSASLEHRGTDVALILDISAVQRPIPLLVDALLAGSHRLLEWSVCRRVELTCVEVPHERVAGLDDYDQIFGAPVKFGASAPALVTDQSILSAAIMRNESDFDEFIRRAPSDLLFRPRRDGLSMTERVRRITEQGIGGQWPTTVDMSNRLGLSAPTVRRKLHEEETSVRRIRDEVLRDAAVASLARGDETIAELSERLGFSEPSAFTRAFKRWTGSAPRSYCPDYSGTD